MKSHNKNSPSEQNKLAGHSANPVVVVESRDNNVDKIRDILFGSQARDFELRLGQLEARLIQASDEIRHDFDARLLQLDTFTRKETERLTARYQQERDSRTEETRDLERAQISLQKESTKRFSDLDDQFARESKDLREQIQQLQRQLHDALVRTGTEMRSHLDTESRRLQGDKVGRDDLADLMSELALRLRGEFDIPNSR
jgi:DNA anti-recombination protein RmuC